MAVKASTTVTLVRVDDGATGNGISKTEVYYYLSTSNTTQTGGSWSTTVPDWVDGRYYWQKIKTTYTSGSTAESTPVCITGAKGSTGSTGTGVESITTEFYLSTSKTTQSGGSWVTTMPTWSSGKYLWTRNKIVYKNPSSTVYTTPVCDSSWEAVNEIEIGGRQLLPNTKDMSGYSISSNVTLDIDSEGFTVGTFTAVDTLAWNAIYTKKPIPFSIVRGHTVTFSLYVRSDDYESINADASRGLNITFALCTGTSDSRTLYKSKTYFTFPLSNEWQKVIWTATLTDDYFTSGTGTIDDDTRLYMQVFDYSVYSMQVKKFKLELGNKPTDWSPAPEDVDDAINTKGEELTQTITEQCANVQTTCEAVILDALKSYTETSDFESFKETVSSQLSLMADNMTIQFNQKTEEINKLNDDLSSKFNIITKYFTFDVNGLTIGQSGSPYKVIIDNDRYSMTVDGVEVMWIANGKVYTPEIDVTKAFRLFGYLIDQDSNGNVNCGYIGG